MLAMLAAMAGVWVLHGPAVSHGTIGAPAKDKAIVITSMTAGPADPNGIVPTLNGVPGAGTINWDIPLPVSILQIGQTYAYSMTIHDVSYTGTCDGSFKLTQNQGGKNILIDRDLLFAASCVAGDVILAGHATKPVPNSPGPATLMGVVTFGHDRVQVKVPMLIQ